LTKFLPENTQLAGDFRGLRPEFLHLARVMVVNGVESTGRKAQLFHRGASKPPECIRGLGGKHQGPTLRLGLGVLFC
jgi:hypothetical protein